MLKTLAEFSKIIAKYAYYPMFIGFIAILSSYVYRSQAMSALGLVIAIICACLSLLALMSKYLCRKAGIDDKPR